ncbi:MAG: Fic family protein [Bacteroidota bacterium]
MAIHKPLVIPDNRFVTLGLRKEGGFVGMHDRVTRTPIPDHISAKWEDLPDLMDGWIQTNNKLERSPFDPVIAAAMLSFGFVFIHPFEDGNGRIHRYIIHHFLSRTGFAPKGFVFPVSAVMLERIDEYRQTLESYSRPLLKHIEWNPTPNGNVDVRNNTADFYRYFDATAHAEFLYQCVQQTVHETLPEEMAYLKHHDAMKSFIEYHFDMPDKTIETLIGFLHQQGGSLSKRARKREFKHLTDDEVSLLESTYDEIFNAE